MIDGTTEVHTILPVSEMIKNNWKIRDLKTDYKFNWLQRLWLRISVRP